MLAQPVSVHMMDQSAKMNLYLVHPVHAVLSQSSGSRISYGGWSSVKETSICKASKFNLTIVRALSITYSFMTAIF